MKRISDAMNRWTMGLRNREWVGADKRGNKYYRYKDKDGERRAVDWNGPYMMYDPNQVPSEWRMWLRKLRDTPPSEEEMAKSEQAAALLRHRVEALEEAERQRRMRAQATGHQPAAPGETDFARLMGQVMGQAPPSTAQGGDSSSSSTGTKPSDGSPR